MPPLFSGIVRLKFDDPGVARELAAGSSETAAIYIAELRVAHVIRKKMISMQSCMNYVVPF